MSNILLKLQMIGDFESATPSELPGAKSATISHPMMARLTWDSFLVNRVVQRQTWCLEDALGQDFLLRDKKGLGDACERPETEPTHKPKKKIRGHLGTLGDA